MTGLWIFNLTLIFVTMYTFRPDRHWVTGQSLTESPVNQPDKELNVDIGDSATLRCCISKKLFHMIYLFKQRNREKPQLIVKFYKTGGQTFYNGFQKSRFQMEISVNCFNMTILNIIQSDEATYYCALMEPHLVFEDGIYLKINETSKPVLRNNSVVCEPTLNGNSTNMNTQEKTVTSLGTALGLCALLSLCLTFFLLIRSKHDKRNTFMENSSGMWEESEAETLNYAALKFPKRKVNA